MDDENLTEFDKNTNLARLKNILEVIDNDEIIDYEMFIEIVSFFHDIRSFFTDFRCVANPTNSESVTRTCQEIEVIAQELDLQLIDENPLEIETLKTFFHHLDNIIQGTTQQLDVTTGLEDMLQSVSIPSFKTN